MAATTSGHTAPDRHTAIGGVPVISSLEAGESLHSLFQMLNGNESPA